MRCLLVADLFVSAVFELAGPPVVLEVLGLNTVLGVLVVVKCVLETALATLAQAEDQEGCDGKDAGCSGTTVDSNVGSFSQVSPLLGGALGWGFVEFVQDSRISSASQG